MSLTVFLFYIGYTVLFASDRFLKNSLTLYMWYLFFKSGCLKLDVSSCSLGLVFRGTGSLEKGSLSALALPFPILTGQAVPENSEKPRLFLVSFVFPVSKIYQLFKN